MAHYGVVDVEGVLFRLDLDGLLPRIDLPANLPRQAGQQHVQRQFRVGDNGLSDGHRADAAQLIHDLLRIVGAGRLWPIACASSEEHTSELQTLMRNSYACFCLKK